jgi:hypothetical protein
LAADLPRLLDGCLPGDRRLTAAAETVESGGGVRQVEAQAASKTRAELRQLAEEADYLAARVYGESVQDDAEFKRVERFRQRAKGLDTGCRALGER